MDQKILFKYIILQCLNKNKLHKQIIGSLKLFNTYLVSESY